MGRETQSTSQDLQSYTFTSHQEESSQSGGNFSKPKTSDTTSTKDIQTTKDIPITNTSEIIEKQQEKTSQFSGSLFTQKRSEKTNPNIETQKPKIETPAATTFSVENKVLKSKLITHLKGITFENVVNKISEIKNDEVKNSLQNYLLQGNILAAQKYVGMKVGSRYPDNQANGIINRETLNRFCNPTFHLSKNELLAAKFIPQDVKEAYLKFSLGIYPTLGQSYLIVSKTNSYMYLFTKDHKLMSIKKCLLGMDKGDQENMARTQGHDWTTPKGIYSAYTLKNPNPYYTGPDATGGDYIVLSPLENQYQNINGYTLGIHGYPVDDAKASIEGLTTDGANTRLSHGCIRTDIKGIVYDYLTIKKKNGSRVYVTADD